jgi:RNA polymerase primary sigma factor
MVLTADSNSRRVDPAPASVHHLHSRHGLSREEECELAARIAAGDCEARNRMVQANFGLVITIARDFQVRGLDMDDLIGEGNLGLIRAAQDFDPRFGTRFSTYAAYWIRAAIRSAVMNTATTIRLPAHVFRLISKWRQAKQRLRREWNRRPTFEEVAAILGLSEAQICMVDRAHQARQLKLESSLSGESGSCLSDEATDRHGPLDERLEADDERAVALRGMGRLDARERAILTLRYGLEGEALTFQQIGHRLGMTDAWARKIERRSIRKLGDTCADPEDGLEHGGRS